MSTDNSPASAHHKSRRSRQESRSNREQLAHREPSSLDPTAIKLEVWKFLKLLVADRKLFDQGYAAAVKKLHAEPLSVLKLLISIARKTIDKNKNQGATGGEATRGHRRSGTKAVSYKTPSSAARLATVLDWMFECCQAKTGAALQSSLAYRSYRQFTVNHDLNPLAQLAFNEELERLGHAKKKGREFNSFLGLRLR